MIATIKESIAMPIANHALLFIGASFLLLITCCPAMHLSVVTFHPAARV
jgi:hypothetical protein